ncbi:MAG: FHA domain-containing protein [Gammaproteobacteria bacterium]|nr:FHA domain-containing protein [Gammaproteobacteria bacterium]
MIKVTFMNGPRDGEEIVVRGPLVRIGHAEGNDIRIDYDPFVSRFHAELAHEPQGWCVTDKQSRNGVYQGSVRVRDKAKLESDELLRIGNTWLEVAVAAENEH